MIRMGKQSKLDPSDVLIRAVAFFGPLGLGMEILEQDDCCARFQSAGGYVSVLTDHVEGKTGSQVTVQGRRQESHIQQFVTNI